VGFLHGVRGKFPEDVSETLVMFRLMTSEDGTHNGSQNVVSKFTSQTVQKPQNQKSRKNRNRNSNMITQIRNITEGL
jgi:hypothetical protein